MLIKSKFKDYYDYISHVYGADEKIVFLRDKIEQVDLSKFDIGFFSPSASLYESKILSICGKYYTIIRTINTKRMYIYEPNYLDDWHVLTEEEFSLYLNSSERFRYWNFRPIPNYENYVDQHNKTLVEISKLINKPIFILNRLGKDLIVESNSPVLQNYGVPHIISAEQMYQNISHFISNVMVESPDIKPPVEVDNKYKIIGAGFDLKQSFRHRK